MFISEYLKSLYLLITSLVANISNGLSGYETTPNISAEISVLKSDSKLLPVSSKVCTSTECQQTAFMLLQNMNLNVKPCDDFYEFACGGFSKKNKIPNDQSHVSTYSKVNDYLQMILSSSLEEEIQPNEIKPFKLAKTLYKNCMDTASIEKQGLKPILEILRKLGGWPVLSRNWDDYTFDWKKAVYANHKLGYSTSQFLTVSIYEDLKNTSIRKIHLDEASLGLNRKYLVNGIDDDIVKAYFNLMTKVAISLGASEERAKKELRESLEFEISLAKICLPQEKRRNATAQYNPMTVEMLSRAEPNIPWLEYINAVLILNHRIEANEVVDVRVPKYFTDLKVLLRRTPKRVQANYLMWRIVQESIYTLNDNIRDLEMEFSSKLTGETERQPRWKECLDRVSGQMYLSVGALYARKYFSETAKNMVIEMDLNIRNELKKSLQEASWMDEETRVAALEKANLMKSFIGYPVEMLDDKKLEEYYASLTLTDRKYLKNMLEFNVFTEKLAGESLRKPVNKTDWINHGYVAYVNAFYMPYYNSFQLPAGILQRDFFNEDRPQYVNYGTLGSTIGHEITHGFDDSGSQFDKEGNLAEWWKKDTKDKFLQKAQCFIYQYGNYTQKQVNMKVNGINTQGENIADNGGIKLAYLAYNRWASEHRSEPQLPGLNYSPKQMFWIAVGTEACGTFKSNYLELLINIGAHSPKDIRVNGPLSNIPQFAEDFNCPIGSPMNPVKKCSLW